FGRQPGTGAGVGCGGLAGAGLHCGALSGRPAVKSPSSSSVALPVSGLTWPSSALSCASERSSDVDLEATAWPSRLVVKTLVTEPISNSESGVNFSPVAALE